MATVALLVSAVCLLAVVGIALPVEFYFIRRRAERGGPANDGALVMLAMFGAVALFDLVVALAVNLP